MERIFSAAGHQISYEKYGSGPPLLLVHGSFSDHQTNWQFVKPLFESRFTIYAIARRGRGETDTTSSHSLEDEGRDIVAVLRSVDQPAFLLGHSYGAHTALAAAAEVPGQVRKLVLYEPASPRILSHEALARLENVAQVDDWDQLAFTFFRDILSVPIDDLNRLRSTELWPPIVADARASLGDLRALKRYQFEPARFRNLRMPVLLQIGTESPRELYATDTLAAVLPDVRIEALPGQAHEGMTSAPWMYAQAVARFLLS